MTPAQRMQIERRLCSLVDEDPQLHVAVVEAAGETKDLSRDGSLALAEACQDLAERLFKGLQAAQRSPVEGLQPGQYL